MLTLPPKRRGREQAACWQLLRFAACFTRPDGTSARAPWQPSPVETTHPHRTELPFGGRILAPGADSVKRAWRDVDAAPTRGRPPCSQFGERVRRIHHVVREAGDPRCPGDGRHDRVPTVVASSTLPLDTVLRIPSWRTASPMRSGPFTWSTAIFADVPVPYGARSITPVPRWMVLPSRGGRSRPSPRCAASSRDRVRARSAGRS